MAKRVFIDMDGVIVDFDGMVNELGLMPEQVKGMDGAYLAMKPIDGAIAGVRRIANMGFDVFIATKPPTGIAYAYRDKAQWIFNNLPELAKKVIITSDKGLLGDEEDYLIDDRPHKANCEQFAGILYPVTKQTTWDQILDFMGNEAERLWPQ